ncbi:MAG: LamG domain-containing protein [Bacteroidetes bacterium]|nr:LamG domain-containing protein [Bacteroidota bacterium]MBS1758107.1 LamG domain-containing protein [Bacteroidota bacterium]
MKKLFIKNLPPVALIIGSIFLASCYKSFDPKSFQPAFTINGYTSSSSIGAGSLVGYWSFNGSYVDSVSGTMATGVNTSFAAGFKGQAMQGSANGYVITDLPAAIKSLNSFTIDYWINSPINSTGILAPVVISRGDQFWGALDMFFENGSTATKANLKVHFNGQSEVWFTNGMLTNPWGGWQNIALTYDAASSTFKLYQGGSVVASQTVTGLGNLVFPATASKLIFGTEQFQCTPSLGTAGGPQGWASYLTGQMDEVRIYNKALSASDLQALIVLQGKGK